MAWIYQDAKQVKAHGEAKAAFCVGWFDPDGKKRSKSFGSGMKGKGDAEKYKIKVEDQLLHGTYASSVRKTWQQFRQEWEEKIGAKMLPQTK